MTGDSGVADQPSIDHSIDVAFEDQVARAPHRLAIKSGHDQLTYGELNTAANRLAHAIVDRLGETEEPVVMLSDGGILPAVGIMGAIKAGKFYVALDPATPKARLANILADTGARLLLTDTDNAALASDLAGPGAYVLDIEHLDPMLPQVNPRVSAGPQRLLNIMYTSGSTGEPKGVLQNHRNALHLVRTNARALRLTPDERMSLLHSYSFGASAANLFGALLTGATVYPFDVKTEGLTRLADWIDRERISLYHSVPTLFRNLLRAVEPGRTFRSLTVVKLGGEPVFRQDITLANAHLAAECIVQLALGTTETYMATAHVVDRTDPDLPSVLPVGYPEHGREIVLVDEQGEPVPAGEAGEIAIVTRFVSPGYWRRPDLTAAAFSASPAGDDRLMYRMGDVGRWRADGALEHLGRKDSQVKIRGSLVSLAAVETNVRQHSGVRDATVVAHQIAPGDNRLVAYVVAHDPATFDSTQLRAALAEHLPAAMVPSTVVVMRELPRLGSGKVDPGALPPPTWERSATSKRFEAPRTPLEAQLAAIWADLLGVKDVGIHDRFLDLGGDSLQATLMIARASEACSTDLPLALLGEADTVSGLADAIVSQLAQSLDETLLEALLAEIEATPGDEASDPAITPHS